MGSGAPEYLFSLLLQSISWFGVDIAGQHHETAHEGGQDPNGVFATYNNQRGNAVMLLQANSRRRSQRANRRHASG